MKNINFISNKKTSYNTNSMNKKNAGFTLIEAMIAISIASIALLGLAAGQMKSLQYAQSSFQYTVALIHANNTIDRIWGDICFLSNTPTNFNDAYKTELAPIDPAVNYTQTFTLTNAAGSATVSDFVTSFTVNVAWTDNRMTDDLSNSISLNASFPTVQTGCID